MESTVSCAGHHAANMPMDQMIVPVEGAPSYSSYLKIKELLSLQTPLTAPEEHDETLFILIHQAYELWFKQILHELNKAERHMIACDLMPLITTLSRIHVIFDVLIHQVDILETMSPSDFTKFRKNLGPASGFQSHQFRLLEFKLGMKRPQFLKFFTSEPQMSKMLEQALLEPSFYELFSKMMGKQGFDEAQLKQELIKVYKNKEDHYTIYTLCEKIIELDAKIQRWRFRHVTMVERMIGSMPGTGGSPGAKYLSSTVQSRFFPDLWDVRNHLG